MAEEAINTPEVEVNIPEAETTATPAPEVTPEVTPEKVAEQTIGDIAKGTEPEVKVNMIPESVFLGEKKARKQAEKDLKALQDSIKSGATQVEISEDIATLAEEHDLDPNFLQKFASTIKKETEAELENKFNSKFKGDEKKEKYDVVFQKALDVALERTPEFKGIANPDVIKNLASIPSNANKTLSQLLEETYGNAIQGKRTIETTTPGGGKDPEPLDLTRAGKDIEYFNEIMKDPKKKEQYNNAMLSKGY